METQHVAQSIVAHCDLIDIAQAAIEAARIVPQLDRGFMAFDARAFEDAKRRHAAVMRSTEPGDPQGLEAALNCLAICQLDGLALGEDDPPENALLATECTDRLSTASPRDLQRRAIDAVAVQRHVRRTFARDRSGVPPFERAHALANSSTFDGAGAAISHAHALWELAAASSGRQTWDVIDSALSYFEQTGGNRGAAAAAARLAAALSAVAFAPEDAIEHGLHSVEYATDANATDLLKSSLAVAKIAAWTNARDEALAAEHLSASIATIRQLRQDWSVVGRSDTPIAKLLMRIYGDIAMVATTVPQAAAAGLRASLDAKHSGVATAVRSQLLQEASDGSRSNEQRLFADLLGDLDRSGGTDDRRELAAKTSDAFAAMAAADFQDVDRIVASTPFDHVIDFVQLPDTGEPGNPRWYRGHIHKNEMADFCEVTRVKPVLARMLADGVPTSEDGRLRRWGEALVPEEIFEAASTLRVGVSAFGHLCRVPWPALQGPNGQLLIDVADIVQLPALSETQKPPKEQRRRSGVHLLNNDLALGIEAERTSWRESSLEVTACDTFDGLVEALRNETLDVAHLACHGEIAADRQVLRLERRVDPVEVVRQRWPASVILAVCEVGQPDSAIAREPTGFVMTILAAGAVEVVAGCVEVDNGSTGQIVSELIGRATEERSMLELLNAAQRKYAKNNPNALASEWAGLAGYSA